MLSSSLNTVCTVVVLFVAIYLWNSQDSDTPKNYRPIDEKLKMESKLSAFVLGATGEVGKAIVKELVKHSSFEKVTLFARRNLELPTVESDADYGKVEQKIIDFEKISDYAKEFEGHQIGFSALGTTRAKAGAEGFYRVDHDYVVQTAKLAKDAGCRHFHLVTSAGANKNAFFLYPKTKGEVEEEISAMDFERLSIYRPALLLVDRVESRVGESVIRAVLKPLDFCRWFSIEVPSLAKVIVENTFRPSPPLKVEILSNTDMVKMVKAK